MKIRCGCPNCGAEFETHVSDPKCKCEGLAYNDVVAEARKEERRRIVEHLRELADYRPEYLRVREAVVELTLGQEIGQEIKLADLESTPGLVEEHRELADAILSLIRSDAATRAIYAAPDNRPKIICLCGSTRFVDTFNEWRKTLTLQGNIILSIELVLPQAEREDPQHHNFAVKQMLDELHLRKIDIADEIFVLNVGGYIGESTAREIAYAQKTGKPVNYLEIKDLEAQVKRE